MVLLLLAIMWAAVLGPALLRNRAEGRTNDSIGAFRRQLGVLQRTGPTLVSPANSLRTRPPVGAQVPLVGSAGPPRAGGYPRAREYGSPAQAQRRRVQQRRREVLMVLVAGLVGSLLLGALPHLHVLWVLSLVAAIGLAGYVAMLIRIRNIAAEKEMKLAYLPQGGSPEPAYLLRRPASY